MKHIVKRKGHEEHFDERKVYASTFAACLNIHMNKKEAEKCADKVMGEVGRWIKKKEEVTSNDISREVIKALKKINEDAAFMYETHRDIN